MNTFTMCHMRWQDPYCFSIS